MENENIMVLRLCNLPINFPANIPQTVTDLEGVFDGDLSTVPVKIGQEKDG